MLLAIKWADCITSKVRMMPKINNITKETLNILRLSPLQPSVSLRETSTEIATGTPAVARARMVVYIG